MPSSKQNTSRSYIDMEVYKPYAWLSKNNIKNHIIANILHYINIDKIIEKALKKKYRRIYYSYSSLVKLILFMKLKGFKSQSETERYLRKHKRERKKLGLKRTPDQAMISKFINHYLTDETKEILSYISDKIIEISKEYKIELDLYNKKKKTKKTDTQKKSDIPKIKKICKRIFKKVKPFFPIHLNYNAVYKVEDYLELFLQMSRDSDFAENASDTLREDRKEKRVFCPNCYQLLLPLLEFSDLKKHENYWICKNCGYEKRVSPGADIHFHHIKKISLEKIQGDFQRLNEMIWIESLNSQGINRSVRAEITFRYNTAVDTTIWKTYPNFMKPDKNNRYIKGGKPEKKDYWGYEFITLDVVEHGKRFTILALPVFPGEDVKKKAKQLIIYAKEQKIFLKNILADKGFYSNDFRKMLDNIKVKYIIPIRRDEEIKTLLEKTSVPRGYRNYQHGNQETLFNMVIVKGKSCWKHHEDIKFAFATNNAINEDTDIEKIASLYPKRWGIETAYRIKKRDYLPKTTSKNPKVRLFYFLYSVFMYNLWFLADILIWLAKHGKVGNFRILKSKFFRCIFKKILSDPG